jgi:hypothetical protein
MFIGSSNSNNSNSYWTLIGSVLSSQYQVAINTLNCVNGFIDVFTSNYATIPILTAENFLSSTVSALTCSVSSLGWFNALRLKAFPVQSNSLTGTVAPLATFSQFYKSFSVAANTWTAVPGSGGYTQSNFGGVNTPLYYTGGTIKTNNTYFGIMTVQVYGPGAAPGVGIQVFVNGSQYMYDLKYTGLGNAMCVTSPVVLNTPDSVTIQVFSTVTGAVFLYVRFLATTYL